MPEVAVVAGVAVGADAGEWREVEFAVGGEGAEADLAAMTRQPGERHPHGASPSRARRPATADTNANANANANADTNTVDRNSGLVGS